MKPEIKQLWLDALPNYEQAKEQLRCGNGFCCLGVLTDLYIKENNMGWMSRKDHPSYFDGHAKLESFGVRFDEYKKDFCEADSLAIAIMYWSGITSDSGLIPYNDRYNIKLSLAEANDAGCTFEQIADLIKHFF
jgi:hypothetical protein